MGTNPAGRNRVFTPTNITLYLMFLPTFLFFLIFAYVPMPGVLIAFADFRVSGFRKWVGLENFRYIFRLPFFWEAFGNTWRFVILRYLFSFPAPILFALLLNEVRVKLFQKTVQTVSTLPHFISWVVIAGIWTTLLSPNTGYVNAVIKALGGQPVFFFAKPALFPYLFTGISVWKEVGYSTIIYLAALAGINTELYESAVIDGAGRLKQALYITLPGLGQTILVVFVLSFAGVLNLFEPIYVLQNQMIISTSEVLDTYTYKLGIVQAKYPLATAVGLFKSTIALALVLAANFVSKRVTEDKRSIL